jgi:hypothetical protein
MIVSERTTFDALGDRIAGDGFVFVRGGIMRRLLADIRPLADAGRFAGSWNDLQLDTYMADGGRYRRRRHATYTAGPGGIVRNPHEPHYQDREYNPLNGGIARWFEPIQPEIGGGPTMTAIVELGQTIFGELAPHGMSWHVEVHQIRIEARSGEEGRPTPEGAHRDGVDYVLVLLVARENVAQGETTIYETGGRPLGSFTLADPYDAALLDDRRVAHGVTPVEPLDPTRPAYRDVLIVTFRSRGVRLD